MTTSDRLAAPLRVDLALTSRCNLRCRYCYFFDGCSKAEEELSTAEWLDVIDRLGRWNVFKLILTGGEPLLREDLPLFVERITRNRMRFRVLSNGVLLTGDTARMLAESGRCGGVQISVDGLRPEHDYARGDGTFDAAVSALGILREYGITRNVRITIGRHNLGKLRPVAAFLLDEMKIPTVGVNWVIRFSDSVSGENPLALNLREQLSSIVEVREIAERYPGRFLYGESAIGLALKRWPEMLRCAETGESVRLCSASCPAPNEKLSIKADGTVVPCLHLPEITLGSVRERSLAELWSSPRELHLRNEVRRKAAEFPECRECRYAPHCSPTCPGTTRNRATPLCLKAFTEAAPDFDFRRMKWRT